MNIVTEQTTEPPVEIEATISKRKAQIDHVVKAQGSFKRASRKRLFTAINYLALPVIIFVSWLISTSTGIVPTILLPTPSDVWQTFWSMLQSGQLQVDLSISFLRVLQGFLIAVALGLLAGVAMGISIRTNRFLIITLTAIRQIPIMAWIPLIILWCGIGESSKVVVIAMASFFPIMVNTIDGIQNTPQPFLELAKLYKVKKTDLFRRVYMPSALPYIFSGLRLALGTAWMVVVAAELVASTSGIGYRISYARSLMESNVVIVGMLVIGFVGLVFDLLLRLAIKRISRWKIT